MMDDAPTTTDPREELFEIAASVRALVEWYEGSGAWGFPPRTAAAEPPPEVAVAPREEPEYARPAMHAPPSFGPPQAAAFAPPQAFAPPPQQAPSFAAKPAFSVPSAAAQASRAPVRVEARTPEERVERLRVLAEEVAGCQRCGLCVTRTNTVFARGNPLAELCFVGEGPGLEEDGAGEPFVGPAGQLLDKMIAAMGFRRDDVYICNIVKCRPPENRKPDADEMEACKSFLTAQLELVRPKYIVALGATAIQGLIGTTEGITRLRGKWKMYKGVPVMPTFHPAYLLRTPTAKRDVWNDLQEVMARLGKKPPTRG